MSEARDPLNQLRIAVPRGALFEPTVELLAGLGVDTAELRSNDRKLLFEDIGVITMRPSDVPTYVEAGAADLGVTGKDVLLEQVGSGTGPGDRERLERGRGPRSAAGCYASSRSYAIRKRAPRETSSFERKEQ